MGRLAAGEALEERDVEVEAPLGFHLERVHVRLRPQLFVIPCTPVCSHHCSNFPDSIWSKYTSGFGRGPLPG